MCYAKIILHEVVYDKIRMGIYFAVIRVIRRAVVFESPIYLLISPQCYCLLGIRVNCNQTVVYLVAGARTRRPKGAGWIS
jgi:hypothetical protein